MHVLEERERQRGDRQIGVARWQYDRVHQGKCYDLELDAGKARQWSARAIKRAFAL